MRATQRQPRRVARGAAHGKERRDVARDSVKPRGCWWRSGGDEADPAARLVFYPAGLAVADWVCFARPPDPPWRPRVYSPPPATRTQDSRYNNGGGIA